MCSRPARIELGPISKDLISVIANIISIYVLLEASYYQAEVTRQTP